MSKMTIPPKSKSMAGAAAGSGRKKDVVYDFVLERLVGGQFRFGERISTSLITEATGASRQPIMTALQTLQSEGFLRIIAQVGCEVISPTAREIEDFYLMFGRIEGILAELAAVRGSREEVEQLRRVNGLIAKLPRDKSDSGLRYRDLNHEFHGIYHEMARSPKLHQQQIVNWAMSDFLIIQTYGFQPHLKAAAEEHDGIIEALAQGDKDAARLAAERHIDSVSKLVTHNMGRRSVTSVQASANVKAPGANSPARSKARTVAHSAIADS